MTAAKEATGSESVKAKYVPALGYRRLTRFYDPLIAALLREESVKQRLVRQTALYAGQRALDLGCGTGTLTIMLERSCPEATVLGLDGDPEAIAIARAKIGDAKVDVGVHVGLAFDPPFPDGSFDRVVSSLLFHHLAREDKRRTLQASHRLLRPGGELHVLDWGEARSPWMRVAFLGVQILDGFETTSDSVHGRLVPMMIEAGFGEVAETHREATLFGTLAIYRAVRPHPAPSPRPHDSRPGGER